MKTVLKTVYELDDVKQKAIEKNRYINVDYDFWSRPDIEFWEEELEKSGFLEPKIYFSGFACQGDGACFDAQVDKRKLLEIVDLPQEKKESLWKIIDEFSVTIERNSFSSHYCHKHTRYVENDFWGTEEEQKIVDEFCEKIESLREDFCDKIYSDLEHTFDELTSDAEVEETLRANEYYFEQNGEIANC